MEPKEVKEVEQIIDLKTSRKKRMKKLKRRKRWKCILSEIKKMFVLLIVAMISAAIIVPLSEAAPAKALLIYEFCTILVIIILVSFCMDKLRGKK